MRPLIPLAFALFGATSLQASETVTVTLEQATENGTGAPVGTVTISQSAYGLVFTPQLQGLEPGVHGFHVHTEANCNAADHGFPWEDNAHLGDLPALLVTEDGSASQPVLAPRLKSLQDLHNRSLMIHAGGDNHADHPQPLGGGGARVACGVIKVPTSTTPI
ncbi:MAG: superoxide dismutase [Cu-Zn] SodC1 [Gammaproteobacteria bacterium HGW-Gammaproteobacteria-12]|nr:MAG: superoxide dismutase [Cu-Zn] SodC1 [Gammaproteobacteria bacterium HGW-Gammaproteobacteria-12]